jgi:YihY family inner membrane protein
MRERLRAIVDVFRIAALNFSSDGASFLAQAVAFNAIFAMIPLSLVIVAMFGYIYGTESGSMRALDTIDRVAPQIYDLVANNLPSVVQYRGISGLIGLAGLVWSAKNVFGAVSYGLDRSLGVPTRHFVIEMIIAVVLVPVIGVVLIVATAIPVIITYVVRFAGLEYLRVLPQIGSYLFSLGFVFVAAAAVYTYLPNRRASWTFGIPGAIVAAVGYSVAQVAFAIYTAHANFLQIYGTLSAIFAVMLWVYLICLIFLFGAHVSAQWERRFGEVAVTERTAAAPTLAS